MKTITGNFKRPDNTPAANALLTLRLSQDATLISNGGQVERVEVRITLDANGNIPAGMTIIANDELKPDGTVYTVGVKDPVFCACYLERFQITGPSPINLNALVPAPVSLAPGVQAKNIELQSNGTDNGSQVKLNLHSSDASVTIVDDGVGNVDLKSAGGGGGGGYSAPLYPRSGAGVWKAWPVTLGLLQVADNYNNNCVPSFVDQPVFNGPTYQVGMLYSGGTGGFDLGYFAGIVRAGPLFKQYMKCRVNIKGAPGVGYPTNIDYRAWIGCGQNVGPGLDTTNPQQALYAFRFDSSVDAHIQCYVANPINSNRVVIDTGIAPDTHFHDYVVDFSDGAHIKFYIDGALVGTVPLVQWYLGGAVFLADTSSLPFIQISCLGAPSGGEAAHGYFTYLYIDYPNDPS